jgi:hypothetical protein
VDDLHAVCVVDYSTSGSMIAVSGDPTPTG